MNSKINSLLHGEMENYIFPFFWQHGESEAVLRKYMQVIYDANIRAVCIESRPHPDFVGAGWWRDMDIILEEARKRKMKVWILDDSHFPTGYCNGKIEEKPDTCKRWFLTYRVFVTPVSYLPGKIPFHASGNFIHVTETHLGRQILIKFPFP
jgi:hypothetical protein